MTVVNLADTFARITTHWDINTRSAPGELTVESPDWL
jgi:hypothetical protein